MNGGEENTQKILVGKAERESPPRRPERRWVDSIKVDHSGAGSGGTDWIDLAQDRDKRRILTNTRTNLLDTQNVGKFLKSFATGCLSRRARLNEILHNGQPGSEQYPTSIKTMLS
jgi:hypothetical protein